MSEERKPKDADRELSAEDLDQAAGGAYDAFLKIDGTPGESTDVVKPSVPYYKQP
jgi:hypothetical protein